MLSTVLSSPTQDSCLTQWHKVCKAKKYFSAGGGGSGLHLSPRRILSSSLAAEQDSASKGQQKEERKRIFLQPKDLHSISFLSLKGAVGRDAPRRGNKWLREGQEPPCYGNTLLIHTKTTTFPKTTCVNRYYLASEAARAKSNLILSPTLLK